MHKEIQEDKAYTFTWRFYDNGIQLVPTAATITITDHNGGAIVTAGICIIDAEGTITYALTAALNDTDGKNFRNELKYTVSSVDHYYYELFDVVKCPLINQVRDEDLFIYVGELRDKIYEKTLVTTSAGSTTTLLDTKLKADRRTWKGGHVEIYINNNITHEGIITAYTSTSGTVTFTPAYSVAIPITITYRIRTGYQDIIDIAYDDHVTKDIRNKVPIKAGYIDSTITKNMTVFKALEIICIGKIEAEDDKWDVRKKLYQEMYKAEYSKLSEPYDIDEDGYIADEEDAERPSYLTRDIVR